MAFKRKIEIIITPPDSSGLSLTDLRISFSVNKTNKQTSNDAVVIIYNLSENSTKLLEVQGSEIIIRAGYEDEGGLKNIFFGYIISTLDSKIGTDRKLEIKAGDGVLTINEKNVSISYKAGIEKQKIYSSLISRIGLPVANTIMTIPGQFANGWSFCGKLKDALSDLLLSDNKKWSIQNNQIVIASILITSDNLPATGLLISPDTGLIGVPELLKDSTDDITDSDLSNRYKIKTLLFPQMFPGVNIQLKSEKVNGTFKIENVNFSGDNYTEDFISEAEIVQV